MIPEAVMDYLMNGKEHGRQGNHDPEMSPHSVYPASGHDQWIAIAASNETNGGRCAKSQATPNGSKIPDSLD